MYLSKRILFKYAMHHNLSIVHHATREEGGGEERVL